MKGIGIIPGKRSSFIDHLVPLCDLMKIPVLVTDVHVKNAIEFYYPPLEVVLAQPDDYILDDVLNDFEIFFYVHFSRIGNGSFFFSEYLVRKNARSVMSLHGHPDKFRDIYWIENLENEDIVLAYGPDLCNLMQDKGIKKKPLICGNYRLEYYKQNRSFFDSRLYLNKEKFTLLYAPTWASFNRSIEHRRYYTSFFEYYTELFETIPDDFHLLVKLHPFLPLMMYEEIAKIKESYPHVTFLDECPLIYPLLNQVDVYLGDYSSIGYDFLYFDRPLFFLNPSQKTPLQDCGISIYDRPVYKTIREHLFADFSEQRQNLYHQVFGASKPLKQLKMEIEDAYRSPFV